VGKREGKEVEGKVGRGRERRIGREGREKQGKG